MRRSVAVPLEGFARDCAQRCAQQHGLSLPDLLALAAGYYLDEAGSSRPALAPPRGLRLAAHREASEYELELPAAQWAALESLAGERGMELGALLEHAVLLLVADLDSGRVAARVAL
jgi:hypothetical protein